MAIPVNKKRRKTTNQPLGCFIKWKKNPISPSIKGNIKYLLYPLLSFISSEIVSCGPSRWLSIKSIPLSQLPSKILLLPPVSP